MIKIQSPKNNSTEEIIYLCKYWYQLSLLSLLLWTDDGICVCANGIIFIRKAAGENETSS